MAHVVGPKGQVVIAKDIRNQLGVEPGWLALQRLVNDHVEVYFLPPEHKKSLQGILAEHIRVHVAPGQEWDKARHIAWDEAAKQKVGAGGQVS